MSKRQIGFSLVYRLMWGFLALFIAGSAFWAGVTLVNGTLAVSTLLMIALGSVGLVATLIVAGRKSDVDEQ